MYSGSSFPLNSKYYSLSPMLNINQVIKQAIRNMFQISLNPLSANGELSYHENLTFLWTWILRCVPRSFATNASLCNTLSSNKLCPKTVKILTLKGLKKQNILMLVFCTTIVLSFRKKRENSRYLKI